MPCLDDEGITCFLLMLAANRLEERMCGIRCLGSLFNFATRAILAASLVAVTIARPQEEVRTISPYAFATLAMIFSGALLLAVTAVRRRDVHHLMKRLRQLEADGESKARVHRLSVTAVAGVLLAIGSMLIDTFVTINVLGYMIPDPEQLACMVVMVSPILLNQYLVTLPFAYLLILSRLTRVTLSRLEAMIRLAASGASVPVGVIAREEQRLLSMRLLFDRLLSFIPFCLLALPFLSVPGMLPRVLRDARNLATAPAGQSFPYEAFSYSWSHGKLAVILILLVWTVCRSRDAMRERTEQLADGVQERLSDQGSVGEAAAMLALVQQLRTDAREISLTGCSAVVIDESLLIAFLSSLVSMSVLVIQLTSA